MNNYQMGVVSVSFRRHTPEEILNEMKTAGLGYIEWGSDVHAPKDDAAALQQLKMLQEFYGIHCCSYGTYFRLGVTPISELVGYINAAKVLGTNILRVWCGNRNPEEFSAPEKAVFFEECKKAARIAEQNGVILCMECHRNTYTSRKESAVELMKTVDSKAFRMYWQPDPSQKEIENVNYARMINEYTEHIHVFHWEGDKRLPLKKGIQIWEQYLAEFKGERALLLEFVPGDKLESLKEEAEALYEIAEMS